MAKAERARTERTPALDLHGAFIRRTNLSAANLRGANLSGADASGAQFRETDFLGARLDGTNLRGADLTGARNLTTEQLSSALIDDQTKLPSYIDRSDLSPVSATLPDPGGQPSLVRGPPHWFRIVRPHWSRV
jgi:uncharacterized protein YjbI with pentapeptide repeats